MHPSKKLPLRREVLRLHQDGLSESGIAIILGLTRQRINQICKELNINGLTDAGRAAIRAAGQRKRRHVERDRQIRALIESGYSLRKAAAHLNVTVGVVAGAVQRDLKRMAPR
ncbi:MAG: hypothetical protein AB1781_11120 [Pseudomonadota bacterium]